MKKLTFVLFFCSHFCFSQVTIRGKVVEQSTRKPIAFTNIGIQHTGVGTLSNDDGTFALRIPENLKTDSVIFSGLGYSIIKTPIQRLQEVDLTIELKEQVVHLGEVVVKNKKDKNKKFELGNYRVGGGTLETDTLYAGASDALLVENTNPTLNDLQFPVYLEKANIRIYRNNLPSFKIRVRLYAVDSLSKEPGNDMFSQSMVEESSIRNGWLTFDFTAYKFVIDKPFFISFERILTKTDRDLIAKGYQDFVRKHPNKLETDTVVFEGKKVVSQKLKGSGIDLPGTFIAISTNRTANEKFSCYTRKTSFAKWEKVRGIIAATVTLSNQPAPSSPDK